ncbi:MAG TPA: type II toxin-antitoxin system prevent-host-death family antitoxin [Polyangiaceae bacterium]
MDVHVDAELTIHPCLPEDLDDLEVAAPVAVGGGERGHRRHEGDALGSPPVEAAEHQDGASQYGLQAPAAKAHLSELVDAAEHHGKRILILRHGKPAAAIVPVEAATGPKPSPMSHAQAEALLDELAQLGDPDGEAVRDLLEGRR